MSTLQPYATPSARLGDPAPAEGYSLFSMRGRLSRSRYLWFTLGIWVGMYVAAFGLGLAAGLSGLGEEAAVIGSLLVSLCAVVLAAFQAVKRFHDLDRPSWHYWLLMIPVYNLYLYFLLLFKPGTEGPNLFGADPLGS